jgi:hypothetical protein
MLVYPALALYLMSQSASDEDDPDVQKNGFSVIQDVADIPEHAMEEFYDEDFDPTATWDENLDLFFERFRKINQTIKNNEDEIREEFE